MNANDDTPQDAESRKVIDLNTREAIVTQKHQEFSLCKCLHLLADGHLRIVTCRDCGKVIDPFNWINQFARTENGAIQRLSYLEDEIKTRTEKVEQLKAEEQKVKSRIREAKNRLLGEMGV